MKLKNFKMIVVVLSMTMISIQTQAQYANSNTKKNKFMFAVGGGGSVVDFSRMSITGGNLAVEVRKPFAHFGQWASISANATVMVAMGTQDVTGQDSKFGILPVGMATINFNAFSQANKTAKQMLGGFIGIGMLATLPQSINYMKGETEIGQKSGVVGPAVMIGPRFKIGKVYMDLRGFGGVTFGGDTELSYAGLNLMFTFGMNGSKLYGLQ